jgi:hypothetical protein
VLVNGFPRLSETFVLQELLELERRGVRLHLFALRRPVEVVQQEALAELRAPVEYLPEGVAPRQRARVRLAHAALLMQRKLGYLNGLADVLASPEYSRSAGVNAALLAHRIVRLGSPPLYIHFAHKPATIGRFASLLAGVPYALSAHAKDIWLTPEAELARKVQDASVVLTCTEQARTQLAGLAGGRTPVHLVHHGVDLKDRTRFARPADATPRLLAPRPDCSRSGGSSRRRATRRCCSRSGCCATEGSSSASGSSARGRSGRDCSGLSTSFDLGIASSSLAR